MPQNTTSKTYGLQKMTRYDTTYGQFNIFCGALSLKKFPSCLPNNQDMQGIQKSDSEKSLEFQEDTPEKFQGKQDSKQSLDRSTLHDSGKQSIMSKRFHVTAAPTLIENTPVEKRFSSIQVKKFDTNMNMYRQDFKKPKAPIRTPYTSDGLTLAERQTIRANRKSIVVYEHEDQNQVSQFDFYPDVQIVNYDDQKYSMFEDADSVSKSCSGYDADIIDLKSPSKTRYNGSQIESKDPYIREANSQATLTIQNKLWALSKRNHNNQPNQDRFVDQEKEIETLGLKSQRSRKSYDSNENSSRMKEDLNQFCIECQEKDPKCCSVNNGIFICLECSEHHRGYGKQISFVRSLELDEIDPIQIKMLEIGGNRKFLEFTKLFMIQNEDSDRHSKYYRKACALYREKLVECAEDDLDFIVDETWLDELPQKEGREMVQFNNFAKIEKVTRRYESQRESSPVKETDNYGVFLTKKIRKIPQFFQQMKSSISCCTPTNVQNEAHADLRSFRYFKSDSSTQSFVHGRK